MVDVELLLKGGTSVCVRPQGSSMYPFILPETDLVVLAPLEEEDKVRRGDILLYRRESGLLVLHRVYCVKQDGLYMAGDNQTELEGPISRKMVRAKMTAVIKKGHKILAKNPIYWSFGRLWLFLYPVRRPIAKLVHRWRVWLAK